MADCKACHKSPCECPPRSPDTQFRTSGTRREAIIVKTIQVRKENKEKDRK